MKAVLTALVAIGLAAGKAGDASAASQRKKAKHAASHKAKAHKTVSASRPDPRTFDETQYYERFEDKVPFGSHVWWRIRDIQYGMD